MAQRKGDACGTVAVQEEGGCLARSAAHELALDGDGGLALGQTAARREQKGFRVRRKSGRGVSDPDDRPLSVLGAGQGARGLHGDHEGLPWQRSLGCQKASANETVLLGPREDGYDVGLGARTG
ncbi:MAG: hypothetical protein HY688_03425 [Chloroflexi bacterium]|nr:hypothetical protein [Chloroflexota bacterium]